MLDQHIPNFALPYAEVVRPIELLHLKLRILYLEFAQEDGSPNLDFLADSLVPNLVVRSLEDIFYYNN